MKYQDNDFDEIDEMLFKYFKENKEVPQKTQNIIKNIIVLACPFKILFISLSPLTKL